MACAASLRRTACSVLLSVLLVACGRVGVRLLPVNPEQGPEGGTCSQPCDNEHGSAACGGGQCTLTCSLGYQDCDGDSANGCEVETAAASDHCGACGVRCSNEHGSTGCDGGLCQPSCGPGYGDCDGSPQNGCETALTSASHCGACGQACSNAHGSVTCSEGVCVPTCSAGHADCDGRPSNGCETATDDDPQHCGGCTTRCDAASERCVSGRCQPTACAPGRSECDGDPTVPCETDLTSSLTSCGFCGNVCDLPNASATCAASSCQIASCSVGFGDCDGQPESGCESTLDTDTAHCGSCDTACANAHGTTSCAAGSCAPVCSTGWGDCNTDPRDGCEADLNSPDHCGTCTRTCPANGGTPQCNAGVCSTQCSLTGVFALKLSVPVSWQDTSVLSAGNATFRFWARVQLTQSGTGFTTSIAPCGETVPDFSSTPIIGETYGLAYANTVFDNALQPAVSSSGTLGGSTPGSSFTLARSAWLLGASMADPINGTWPSRTGLSSVDGDADGKLGVSAPYKTGSGYSSPPTNSLGTSRARRAYLATRVVFSASGSLTSCSASSGSASAQDVDYHTLGCQLTTGADCSSSDTSYLDSNGPDYQTGSASYSLVRVADSATCAAIRAAVP